MHALVKGAIGAAALSLVGLLVARSAPVPSPTPSASASAAASAPAPVVLAEMPCPARHVPEGQACVPLPDLGIDLEAAGSTHVERRARGAKWEVIPRKPDRSADPFMFVYPLEDEPLFLRGYDDTLESDLSPVSLELAAVRGAPVRAVALDGQQGKAKVVATGRLIGSTVVTRHEIETPGAEKPRTVLLVMGHLEAIAPDLKAGAEVGASDVVGFVGDSGNPGIVSLYLEARLVRQDVALDGLALDRLVDPATSVPTDLRNVLALR